MPLGLANCVKLLLVACGFLGSGCGHRPLPDFTERQPTYALADPSGTRLNKLLTETASKAPGESGFSLTESGPQAFASIRSLIATADRTLDLQYYIWRNDQSGRTLLRDLLEAAARGVRVRLLLDDLETAWPDHQLALLSTHPNLDIRIFNPFSRSRGRVLDTLLDFDRVTNRMHNKLFIADNSIAIIGGRNVGNRYFTSDQTANFRDLDIHAAGPIVPVLSTKFDAFWNSNWSLSIATLNDDRPASKNLEDQPRIQDSAKSPVLKAAPADDALVSAVDPKNHLEKLFAGLIWTKKAAVFADAPNKPRTDHPKIAEELAKTMPVPREEILLETAYLVPGRHGVKALCDGVARGVRVRILTNSYASIDSIFAYAGYRKYREDLLECGVDVNELRPDGETPPQAWRSSGSGSTSILHTKAAVIDRRYLFIGSVNYDPRSSYLNTEIAVLIDSPAIAEAARKFMLEGFAPENSWALSLKGGEIKWTTTKNSETIHTTEEPGLDTWGDILSTMVNLLPIENQI